MRSTGCTSPMLIGKSIVLTISTVLIQEVDMKNFVQWSQRFRIVVPIMLTAIVPLWLVSAADQQVQLPAFQSAAGVSSALGERGWVDTTRLPPLAESAIALGEGESVMTAGEVEGVPRGDVVSKAMMRLLKQQVRRGKLPITRANQADAASETSVSVEELQQINVNAPAQVSSFDAIPFTGSAPPDPIIAAGPSDLVVAVNAASPSQLIGRWRIYDRGGGQLFSQDFLTWFANVLPSDTTGIAIFDPWVLYDQLNGRFIIGILALARTGPNAGLSRFLISTSNDDTAVGNWCNWSLDARLNGPTDTNNWADRLQVGVTNNAIILTTNMTSFADDNFQYAKVRFLPKSALYDPRCPGFTYWDFWDLRNADDTAAFQVMPARSYVNSNTGYLINSRFDSGTNLTLWRATTPPAYPPAPILTRQATIGVASYSMPPDAQQRDTTTRIDTVDARLLNAVLRLNGLWTTHSIACTWPGDAEGRSCLRWYQINPSRSVLVQQSTFGLSGFYYFFPSIEPDDAQNAVIGFSRSSASEYVSIRYTGRRSNEPLNTLQGSAQLRAGEGCYIRLVSGDNRWGDYSGSAIDPTTGATWIFNEYAAVPPGSTSTSCSTNTWGTTVGLVRWE
jgi:hypothetical protein